ncbi:LexA family protein [Methylacidiphilum kamchatkense]|uniref:Peptidase S24-like protein n=1 Tax=Methylacidiphilum kamchatkense Kam1 TaxID=1202785 RepID=A0A516TMS6_9BACT|nr:translesion error-prone DNA polymerase V autoproteolytic subunit [Methylacidiphilum kamchatkense]QDQ42541.1 peptidase S24-like protein [Methylacidiphilum kamchatkense Kam1]
MKEKLEDRYLERERNALCDEPLETFLTATLSSYPPEGLPTESQPALVFSSEGKISEFYRLKKEEKPWEYPLYGSLVAAGFPNPGDDYLEKSLSLDELLVKRPSSTFFVRASGYSMEGEGIRNGDILVVDRAETPKNGSIVIAAINGELAVKKLRIEGGRAWLLSVPHHQESKAFL